MGEYVGVLIFLVVSVLVGVIALGASHLISPRIRDKEKDSPYECGFSDFGDARFPFDVRYYLLAIVFVVFDIELAFLLPWAVVYTSLGWLGFFAALIFLIEFVIVLTYLWKRGALDWD